MGIKKGMSSSFFYPKTRMGKNGGGEPSPGGAGEYKLVKCVGQGGSATVLIAKRTSNGEYAAVKVFSEDKSYKGRREEDILTALTGTNNRHPFVVRLRDSYETRDKKLCLVLDFLSGGDLEFHKDRLGSFNEDVARFYVAEILSAVTFIHSKGIVHRDIKTDNIVLDSEGHAVLADFGCAVLVGFGERITEGVRGTLYCLAPEMLARNNNNGLGHDKCVDWWGLGVLLFELVTGEPPFSDEDPETLREMILNSEVRMPSFLSPELRSLLSGLLTKDPKRRLGSSVRDGEEIMGHPWFRGVDWKKVVAKSTEAPIKPYSNGDARDNFRTSFTKQIPAYSLADVHLQDL